MNVRYRVELSQIKRDELVVMLGDGKHAARKLKRAQILLAADGGCRDEEIARTVSVSLTTTLPEAVIRYSPRRATRPGIWAHPDAARFLASSSHKTLFEFVAHSLDQRVSADRCRSSAKPNQANGSATPQRTAIGKNAAPP